VSDVVRYGLVAVIVFLTHVQEGITGFGCTVLALPFVMLLLGLHVAVPVLVIQAWVLTVYIVFIARREIVWAEYGRIVALAGIGLPLGIWMSGAMPEAGLKWVLAAFMVGVGIHGLLKQAAVAGTESNVSSKARLLASSLLPLGGIIHGAFGSGGPLVVIYATKALPDKSLFRVTLCMLWLTLNTILITQWAIRSTLNGHILRLTLLCLPFTVVGMVLGNVVHHRVNEILFRRIVYAVLAASGIALVLSIVL